MNSSHTQVWTRTLPRASFGSASRLPWLPRPVSLDTCTLFPPSACCPRLSSRGALSPQMLKWWSLLSPEPRAWTHCRSSSRDTYASAFWPFYCIRPFLLTECPCDDTGSHYQLWSVLIESTAYPRHSLLAVGNFASVLYWKKAINNTVIKNSSKVDCTYFVTYSGSSQKINRKIEW